MTSAVPPGRASLHRYPGTLCLATISLSLRDKAIRLSKRLTIILALMEFQSKARPYSLLRANPEGLFPEEGKAGRLTYKRGRTEVV